MGKKARCIEVDDKIWDIAKEKSKQDGRSISNWISILILKENNK